MASAIATQFSHLAPRFRSNVDGARQCRLPPRSLDRELKGRKATTGPRGARSAARRGRLENWVTREDVRSMLAWEQLFGPGFTAAFVFLYRFDALPPDGLFAQSRNRGKFACR